MDEFYSSSEKLLKFIEKSPSCFHVVNNISEELEAKGYKKLSENERWELTLGGRYYVVRNGSSLIAFHLPSKGYDGFQLICSHSDSPTFKIKSNPEMEADKKYT